MGAINSTCEFREKGRGGGSQMQKLSVIVLEKMIKANVTSKEIDFLLYIARFQNEYGIIQGIYYRDIMDYIHVSHQTFYDCKKSLEEKGIIECVKNSYYDWDIVILDNNFKGKENYGRGYVSLHNDMVRSIEFMELKAGAKLMALWLMREWQIYRKKTGSNSYQINKQTLLKKFTELMHISSRVIRRYLGMLTPWISIYLEKGEKYYITFQKNAVIAPGSDSENGELREHDIRVGCRRNRIKDIGNREKKDLITVLTQHNKQIEKLFDFSLSDIIHKSLEIINQAVKDKHRWKRLVNVPLIHKVLIQELG